MWIWKISFSISWVWLSWKSEHDIAFAVRWSNVEKPLGGMSLFPSKWECWDGECPEYLRWCCSFLWLFQRADDIQTYSFSCLEWEIDKPNLHASPATGVSLPQALGKLLEQGSELTGLWEWPEVNNNLSLSEASLSQMRKTRAEEKKGMGIDQYELTIDKHEKQTVTWGLLIWQMR